MNDPNNSPIERLKDLLNTPNESAAIKAVCRQLLKSLNLNDAPIPLRPICNKFNLKVNYNNYAKKEDSFLKLSSIGYEIEISKLKNWRRNRFTIAHELSHLIIYNLINLPISSYDKKQHTEIERICDIGASELLMPEDELNKNLREFRLDTEGIKKLYDKFLVSHDALFSKLSDSLSANIIIWRKHARNISENKEFRVYRHFPNYKYARKTTWLPIGCTTKHINPNIFKDESALNETLITNDLEIIMNNYTTKCYSLSFAFPHSRKNSLNFPIFENLSIDDESTYDDCYIMIVFHDQASFTNTIKHYL